MILDGHIHIRDGNVDQAGLVQRMGEAGVEGGILVSMAPSAFRPDDAVKSAAERLDNVMAWAQGNANLFPFYWIDPADDDAVEQVAQAVEKGVAGFKIICDQCLASDELVMEVAREIAAANRPILFHSGILWDGKASSAYNRPADFEALLEIDGLKFSLAHVSWPWCDECIAVYGKFQNARSTRPALATEMFIDTTPGTPAIYRQEVLTRLFTVGYDVENNVIFGTDCRANDYNVAWAKEWLARDQKILEKLKVGAEVVAKVFGGNLQRLVQPTSAPVEKKALRPAE